MNQGQLRVTTTEQYKKARAALSHPTDARSDHERAMFYQGLLDQVLQEIDFVEKKWEAENDLERIEKMTDLINEKTAEAKRLMQLVNTLAGHVIPGAGLHHNAASLAVYLRQLAEAIDVGMGKKSLA